MYPAVISTCSHRRPRQTAGSGRRAYVRVQGLAASGIGRYADGIRPPHHCAASTRRQSANARTRVSTHGVVTSPTPIGTSAMDTRDSVKHRTAPGRVTRASTNPRPAATATARTLVERELLFVLVFMALSLAE